MFSDGPGTDPPGSGTALRRLTLSPSSMPVCRTVTLISRASIMRYPVVSYPIIGEFPNLSTVSSQNVYILQKEQGTPRFWRSLLKKWCQKLVAAQVGGLVALDADAELVVIAGQDGVEDHARQGGDVHL